MDQPTLVAIKTEDQRTEVRAAPFGFGVPAMTASRCTANLDLEPLSAAAFFEQLFRTFATMPSSPLSRAIADNCPVLRKMIGIAQPLARS